MTRRRIIEPGLVWALSRRTTRRHFILNPDEARQVEQAYWYCLGHAAELHGVVVHAACLMSTHSHEVVTDVRADQNVPDLVLCPASAPACAETFHPDGSYDLPAAVYANPAPPMGMRFNANNALFIPLQCAMAEPGGLCAGQTDLGCLTDADCAGFGPCDLTVAGVSMPTPDSSLLSVPIE